MALNIDPLGAYKVAVESANEIGQKIVAANSDKTEAVKAFLDTSDDKKIVAYREGRAKILAEIENLQERLTAGETAISEYAEDKIPGVDPDFDKEAATEEFLKRRKAAHAARNALLNFVSEEELSAAEKELGIVPVVSLRGKKGTRLGGGGTGVRRPRISAATVDGQDVWKKGKEGEVVDFTTLANVLKSSADDVKKAAFEAAGTEDLNSLEPGTKVPFTFGDHKIVVTISAKKPGRQASE